MYTIKTKTQFTMTHRGMYWFQENIQTIIITTHKLQMILLSSKMEQIKIQTIPGYGTSSYYYQNNDWNGGSSGNNCNQSYQNYLASDNAVHSSSSVPGNSQSYQQQYNQWPCYYNHPVPSATGNLVAGNISTDNGDVSATSGYSRYPSVQPPPPGTTTWTSNSSASVAPPMQAPGVPEPQSQYVNQAQNMSGSQNQYVSQAPAFPQNTVNFNNVALNRYEDQQKTVSVTTDTSSESKIQISTNPQIAPGFSMVVPRSSKKNLGADLVKKHAYVSVSMPKNDSKAAQLGPDTRSLPFSLSNYAMRNFSRCKDDAQRATCQSIINEIKNKATADGTLLTKNWDTEPLFPLPKTVITMTAASSNNLSPFSTSTPRRRLKSRWEPIVDEKVADKAEPLANGLVNGSTHSIFEAKNITGNSLDFGKFLQFRETPLIKVSQRPAKKPAKKRKIGCCSIAMQNGTTSSDIDKKQNLTKHCVKATALANSPEEKKRREHRSKRFEKSKESSSKSKNFARNIDAMATQKRRAISALTRSYEDDTSLAVEDMDWDTLTVKGTCEEIEKRYLRLTSAPDPATVRPEHVLEKALSMVETSQMNYHYKCDQLKSIRQDLTVQRIQNELTVKVYETHARLAMQAGDLAEHNQCQSQLKRLYTEGIDGCYFEFSAYNLLCVMLHSNNKRDLLSSMASLSKEAKEDGAVKHALAVHSAISYGNYVLFFKLYKKAPNLNSCLMDLYVERMRFEAIKCMSRSYRPTVPTGYIARILGFSKGEGCIINEGNGTEECEAWLKAHGGILSLDNSGESQLDTKASSTTLHMPEPDNAVAHGDASLAVNDFLAQTS